MVLDLEKKTCRPQPSIKRVWLRSQEVRAAGKGGKKGKLWKKRRRADEGSAGSLLLGASTASLARV